MRKSLNSFFGSSVFLVITMLFVSTVLISCQTRRHKEFESVRSGMPKSEVLAKVGSPQRTQRWQGRDRWEYVLYGHSDGDVVREVHFENGIATYVGPAIKPAISAETQDRINDSINHAADARDSETAKSDSTGIQIQRFESVDTDEEDKSSVP